jgi:chromosome segregation protein
MHLKKLELNGFKTFANKTELQFLPPDDEKSPITAIVGPNGSGKSNLADAIRWVLGEQSMKRLRGKKSEDVIFSGSEGKVRSGFAEVSITLDNEDRSMPIEYAEVTITRRLYRDGQSEYLVNQSKTRLKDIKLLLAQANVGQRSYSVIGQGMVDHILVSSPEERKEFFDDATGVKPFQIKRHKAMLKLKRTYENLSEVEMLLREIKPRLRSLKRQVNRLEQRDEVEEELLGLEKKYYGTKWWKLIDKRETVDEKLDKIDKNIAEEQEILDELDAKVEKMEQEEKEKTQEEEEDDGMGELQKTYRKLQKKHDKIRNQEFQTEKEIELKKARAQSNWAPLPLSKILSELKDIRGQQSDLKKQIKHAAEEDDIDTLVDAVDALFKRTDKLVSRLQKPNPDDIKPDPKLVKKRDELKDQKTRLKKRLDEMEEEMEEKAREAEQKAKKEKRERSEIFDVQRKLRAKQKDIHKLETKRNNIEIEKARLEERQESVKREMDEHMEEEAKTVRGSRLETFHNTQELYPKIQKLRRKLELIGGIDPEIVSEYEDTKSRHEFLQGQVDDLHDAIRSTEKVIDEMDGKIQKQSKQAFNKINKEFKKYFKLLFGGGSAKLVKMTKADMDDEENEVSPDRVSDDTAEEERRRHEADTDIEEVKKRIEKRDRVVGIDIQATPPGKKMKNLNLLSGGERALTSIALLSAIMSVNPSPFVVLDEVDAALDESNTVRFAAILEELQENTQFVIITHNRATMERADVLYGVTMGDNGVSNMLSVKMEDVEEYATSRR